jgi:hypothetical protein
MRKIRPGDIVKLKDVGWHADYRGKILLVIGIEKPPKHVPSSAPYLLRLQDHINGGTLLADLREIERI